LETYHRAPPTENLHNAEGLRHLNLLNQAIKDNYISTTNRLSTLLARREITFDLLWAFFKPNTYIYTTCPGTGKPKCVKYDLGGYKTTNQNVKVFELDCRYYDFDGKLLGEVTEKLAIEEFRGARCIDKLEVFPLQYHPDKEEVEGHFLACGEKFVSMIGSHHRRYQGQAFFQHKNELHKIYVDGRIMVDAGAFQKSNPNYPRLRTPLNALLRDLCDLNCSSDRVRSSGTKPSEMKQEDLLICCPTLLGFSLSKKVWGETSATS
jgi:hypothetical protein